MRGKSVEVVSVYYECINFLPDRPSVHEKRHHIYLHVKLNQICVYLR